MGYLAAVVYTRASDWQRQKTRPETTGLLNLSPKIPQELIGREKSFKCPYGNFYVECSLIFTHEDADSTKTILTGICAICNFVDRVLRPHDCKLKNGFTCVFFLFCFLFILILFYSIYLSVYLFIHLFICLCVGGLLLWSLRLHRQLFISSPQICLLEH